MCINRKIESEMELSLNPRTPLWKTGIQSNLNCIKRLPQTHFILSSLLLSYLILSYLLCSLFFMASFNRHKILDLQSSFLFLWCKKHFTMHYDSKSVKKPSVCGFLRKSQLLPIFFCFVRQLGWYSHLNQLLKMQFDFTMF